MLARARRAGRPDAGNDGVDGTAIYVYGEGWNFGEVANNARGVNATQFNMAGTGIGTFNDRLRDAVRGGSPFDGGAAFDARRASSTASTTTRTRITADRKPTLNRAAAAVPTRSGWAWPAIWPTISLSTATATW